MPVIIPRGPGGGGGGAGVLLQGPTPNEFATTAARDTAQAGFVQNGTSLGTWRHDANTNSVGAGEFNFNGPLTQIRIAEVDSSGTDRSATVSALPLGAYRLQVSAAIHIDFNITGPGTRLFGEGAAPMWNYLTSDTVVTGSIGSGVVATLHPREQVGGAEWLAAYDNNLANSIRITGTTPDEFQVRRNGAWVNAQGIIPLKGDTGDKGDTGAAGATANAQARVVATLPSENTLTADNEGEFYSRDGILYIVESYNDVTTRAVVTWAAWNPANFLGLQATSNPLPSTRADGTALQTGDFVGQTYQNVLEETRIVWRRWSGSVWGYAVPPNWAGFAYDENDAADSGFVTTGELWAFTLSTNDTFGVYQATVTTEQVVSHTGFRYDTIAEFDEETQGALDAAIADYLRRNPQAPGQGVTLSDDAVLDLAKETRTAADRGFPLGSALNDENDLTFLTHIVPFATGLQGWTAASHTYNVEGSVSRLLRYMGNVDTTLNITNSANVTSWRGLVQHQGTGGTLTINFPGTLANQTIQPGQVAFIRCFTPTSWQFTIFSYASLKDIIGLRPMSPLYRRTTSNVQPGLTGFGTPTAGSTESNGYRTWNTPPTNWMTSFTAPDMTNNHAWVLQVFQVQTREGWQDEFIYLPPVLHSTHSSVSPVSHPTLRGGTSADSTPLASELNIEGVNGTITVPAYTGARHLLIARLNSEGDISSILFSDDTSNTNQIGVFTKSSGTLTVNGQVYAVWVSNQMLTQTEQLVITVA